MKCGAELDADAFFCEECGAPQERQATPQMDFETEKALVQKEEETSALAQETSMQDASAQTTSAASEALPPMASEQATSAQDAPVQEPAVEEAPPQKTFIEESSLQEAPGATVITVTGDTGEVSQDEAVPSADVANEAALAAVVTARAEKKKQDARKPCIQCGTMLEIDAAFCLKCGAAQAEKPDQLNSNAPRACVQCGAALEEGAAFCSKCGTAQSKASATSVPKVCVQCGSTLELDAAFCSKCGTAQPKESILPAHPQKKFCPRCGASLSMESMFCNTCGTPQGIQPQPQLSTASVAQMGQQALSGSINLNTETFQAWSNKIGLNQILLAASAVIALSVFLPIVKMAGGVSQKLTDISVVLSVIVLIVALGAAYASMRGKYEIPVVAGHSFLVLLLFGIFKYQSQSNEIRAEWGAYILSLAIVGVIVVGLMAVLQREGKAPDPNLLADCWKRIMLRPVQIRKLKLQGIIGAIALALLMVCIPLVGSFGGGIMGDKFEGEWFLIKPKEIPHFIKLKKLADGKYAFADCRIYIAYDSDKHRQYLTTGNTGGIFAAFTITTHHIYEFANEKKNTIVDTDDSYVPKARSRYYYDSEKKALLNGSDDAFLPMGKGLSSDKELKQAYDALLEYHKNDSSLKGGTPPSFEEYKDAVKKVLDGKIKEEEKYYERQTR